MNTEQILQERGDRYGSYQTGAETFVGLLDAMESNPGWSRLTARQKNSLVQIQAKVARIVNGDGFYRDNWQDILGYTELEIKEIDEYEALEDEKKHQEELTRTTELIASMVQQGTTSYHLAEVHQEAWNNRKYGGNK